MSDLTVKGDPFEDFLQFITTRAPGFSISSEFKQMSPNDKQLPYVVCGYFASYFSRIFKSSAAADLTAAETEDLARCFLLMKELAADEHPDGRLLLTDGIFDGLRLNGTEFDLLERKLTEPTKTVFREWRKGGTI